jgi:hypothetical protein
MKCHEFTAGLSVIAALACDATPSDVPPGPQSTHQLVPIREDVEARRRALLVGINDYKYDDDISDLNGTANDVEAIRDVLTRRFGFKETDLLILKDKQATKANILGSFRDHLIEGAGADTIAVFYYSGHGSQMYDVSGDEPDSYDETIVSHDSGRSKDHPNNDVSDDEFNGLLAELSNKTKHTTVIFDSCHSGSGTRAAGKARSAPPDDRGRPAGSKAAQSKPTAEERFRDPALAYTFISGARTDEYSYEHSVAGKSMGALTSSLTRAFWSAAKDDTYRDVLTVVQSEVTQSFPRQHPQLEGNGQDSVLFGMKELESDSFLGVATLDGQLVLHGGLIHGVTKGSKFALFAPHTKDFVAAKPIAQAFVKAVTPTTATLELESDTHEKVVPVGARAVEVSHATERNALRVYVDPLPALAAVTKALAKVGHLALLAEPANYDLRVTTDERRNIVLEGGTPGALSTPVAPGPSAVDAVVADISAWAKWHALSRLTADSRYTTGPLPVHLQLSTGSRPVTAGKEIQVAVTNDSNSKLYVSLLDLGADGSISLVYPAPGALEFIDPGNTWKKAVVPCSPKGATGQVRDIVKVIVTKDPHDLSFITQPGLVHESAKGLGAVDELLLQLLNGETTRGLSRAEREASSWATRQLPLLIDPSGHTCAQ